MAGNTDNIEVDAIAFSPNGSMLVCSAWRGVLELWDPKAGALLKSFDNTGYVISSLAFSPDSSMLVAGEQGYSATDSLEVWSVPTCTQIQGITGDAAITTSLAFSPDGKTLAIGSWDVAQTNGAGYVSLWNLPTRTRIMTIATDAISCLTFSPDGLFLFVATGPSFDGVPDQARRTLQIYRTSDYTQVALYDQEVEQGIRSLVFSHDDSRFYYGRGDGVLVCADNPCAVLFGLSLSQSSMQGEKEVSLTVSLTHPAPAGGVTIQFFSGNPAVAKPEVASLTIPSGAKTGVIKIQTHAVSKASSVYLVGRLGSVQHTTTLLVTH